MHLQRRNAVAVVLACAASLVCIHAGAMGTTPPGAIPFGAPETDAELWASQVGPLGAPCGGLAVRLSFKAEAEGRPGAGLATDLEIVNLSREPIAVDLGLPGEFMQVLLVFDATGRALRPPDMQAGLSLRGYDGSVTPRLVELQPGKGVNTWQQLGLRFVCRDLGLAEGSYVAQALLVTIPELAGQRARRVLLSNPLPFEWPGPEK